MRVLYTFFYFECVEYDMSAFIGKQIQMLLKMCAKILINTVYMQIVLDDKEFCVTLSKGKQGKYYK